MVTVEDLLQKTAPTGKHRSTRGSINNSSQSVGSSNAAETTASPHDSALTNEAGSPGNATTGRDSGGARNPRSWNIGKIFKWPWGLNRSGRDEQTVVSENSATANEGAVLRRYSEITRELLENWVDQDAPELVPEDEKLGETQGEQAGEDSLDQTLPPNDLSYRRRVSRKRRFIRALTCGIDPDPENGDAEPTPQLYAFRNQELPSVKPLFLPWFVALILLILGGACLGIGIYLSVGNNSLHPVLQVRYDDKCTLDETDCEVRIDVPMRLTAPVYVWYHLTNFYSNYRVYDESRSARMNEGHWPLSYSQVQDCLPLLYGGQITSNNPQGYLVPCGLVQFSQFNDTIHLCSSPGVPAQNCSVLNGNDWTDVGIAWQSDINALYHNGTVDPPFTSRVNARITSPDYIVWQRISSGPNFLRLYRIIHRDLEPGTYSLRVNNAFNSYAYNGRKYVNLGKVTVYGMRNTVLQIAYLVTAGVLLVCSPLVMVTYWLSHRRIADPNSVFLKQMMDEIDDAAWTGGGAEHSLT
ncbi:Cell cycle control protein [Cyanidiococcus yangmingshanensis]|uniref:Cell cycle control protein n=1 Tax=Cyanidiococcus yangmingshanensis TaxID=2690220 RepID=A0A7J7IR84_9RHOD|nr:Cell cycle control protein [Cyanidiococcus yangmingshanensis]